MAKELPKFLTFSSRSSPRSAKGTAPSPRAKKYQLAVYATNGTTWRKMRSILLVALRMTFFIVEGTLTSIVKRSPLSTNRLLKGGEMVTQRTKRLAAAKIPEKIK